MPKQAAYDVYQNSGGGQEYLRKIVQNNQEPIPMAPLPSDFGLLGWSIDPQDINTVAQAVVSGTQYLVRLSNPFNMNAKNSNAINKVGLQIGTTAAATPGTYSGFALYSYVLGATTMTKLADTGADDGAAWVTASTSNYMEGTLSSAVSAAPGYLYASFIATFTTTPTVWANTLTPASIKIKGVTVNQGYTNGTQTSFPTSITIPGSTSAMTFVPLMGVANS